MRTIKIEANPVAVAASFLGGRVSTKTRKPGANGESDQMLIGAS
jgi:hypothetical protein